MGTCMEIMYARRIGHTGRTIHPSFSLPSLLIIFPLVELPFFLSTLAMKSGSRLTAKCLGILYW